MIAVEVSSGADATFTHTQASGCAVTLPVEQADAPASGGDSSFAVLTDDGCEHTATSDSSWVTVSLSNTGVAYEVDAWEGAERVAVITVTSTTTDSSATFTLTQADGCSLMLTPGDVEVDAGENTIELEVTTHASCTIAATTDADFIGDIEIDGSTITAVVAANDGGARMGILVVTAGESMGEFVVQQEAAEDTLPDGGPGDPDGGPGDPDAGLSNPGTRPDSGFDFDDLEVGGGCTCHIAGGDRSPPNALGALLLGLALALALARRIQRRRR